ncbi:putative DNA-directed RNA polymerase [Halotydeus destructor]|nr:putative DNA-directed RNA polymerase [Halotydeus destructor]
MGVNSDCLDILGIVNDRLEHYNLVSQSILLALASGAKAEQVFFDASKVKSEFTAMSVVKESYHVGFLVMHGKRAIRIGFPWLVMIGSDLDICVRKVRLTNIGGGHLRAESPLVRERDKLINAHFKDLSDIFIGCFFINGGFKHIPLYIVNNCQRYHQTKNQTVRKYFYTGEGDGFKIDFCKASKVIQVTDNHGVSREGLEALQDVRIPKTLDLSALLQYMERICDDELDIDQLENKIVIESAEFLYRIVMREVKPYIIEVLKTGKTKPQVISILKGRVLNGQALVECLSRKTTFNCGKRTGCHQMQFGAQGQVFVEKENSMFMPVNLTSFQLSPFMTNTGRRVFSEKTKTNRAVAFNASHMAFICPLFTSESKNIGKTVALCRNVHTSFHSESKISKALAHLEKTYTAPRKLGERHLIVLNHLPHWTDSEHYELFEQNLLKMKRDYGKVEVYVDVKRQCKIGYFSMINSIIFKRVGGLWLSPAEFRFWLVRIFPCRDIESIVDSLGFDFVSSHFSILAPMSRHNSSAKVTLLLNNWRNAILATDQAIGMSVFEPVFAVKIPQPDVDIPFFKPVDEFSNRFQVYIPKIRVGLTWAGGWNQEDCLAVNSHSMFAKTESVVRYMCSKIVCRIEIDRRAISAKEPLFTFHTMDYEDDPPLLPVVLGYIHESNGFPFSCSSYCPGLSFEMERQNLWRVLHCKPRFKICQSSKFIPLTKNLGSYVIGIVMSKTQHLSDGDKLCSLNGQKGVVKLIEPFIHALSGKPIDLFLHPTSVIKRQTMGELLMFDGAKQETVEVDQESHRIMVAETLFLQINYRSEDSLYVSDSCVIDAVMNQPTKGSNRNGAMKIGPMEIRNCLVGHGIAETAFELLVEQSDIDYKDHQRRTTAFELCDADAKFLKCCFETEDEDMIDLVPLA